MKDKENPCVKAQEAVGQLSLRIQAAHDAIKPRKLPSQHTCHKFKKLAACFAARANRLETQYTHAIFAAAAEITAVSHAGWKEDANILRLWHQLADAVTKFSEHPDPTKRVATLIINRNGTLRAFGVNRTPEGLSRRGSHFVKGIRKNFILCSERIALARLLGIGLRREPHLKTLHRNARQAWRVEQLTKDILSTAQRNKGMLEDSFVLTTTSPCEICATALSPFRPRGIITNLTGGRHFTRCDSIMRGTAHLTAAGIDIIPLPQLRAD